MNTKHLHNKFTFKYEHNSSFSYLDVKICHKNNELSTYVYRKPTFCRLFTDFTSFIPTVYKLGLVLVLIPPIKNFIMR